MSSAHLSRGSSGLCSCGSVDSSVSPKNGSLSSTDDDDGSQIDSGAEDQEEKSCSCLRKSPRSGEGVRTPRMAKSAWPRRLARGLGLLLLVLLVLLLWWCCWGTCQCCRVARAEGPPEPQPAAPAPTPTPTEPAPSPQPPAAPAPTPTPAGPAPAPEPPVEPPLSDEDIKKVAREVEIGWNMKKMTLEMRNNSSVPVRLVVQILSPEVLRFVSERRSTSSTRCPKDMPRIIGWQEELQRDDQCGVVAELGAREGASVWWDLTKEGWDKLEFEGKVDQKYRVMIAVRSGSEWVVGVDKDFAEVMWKGPPSEFTSVDNLFVES